MSREVSITHRNSTVDGRKWPKRLFTTLDFSVELYPDDTYQMGCLKYVPSSQDYSGHRVRSTYASAEPVKRNGKWMWSVRRVK